MIYFFFDETISCYLTLWKFWANEKKEEEFVSRTITKSLNLIAYSHPQRPRSFWWALNQETDPILGACAEKSKVCQSWTSWQIWQIWLARNTKQILCVFSENRVKGLFHLLATSTLIWWTMLMVICMILTIIFLAFVISFVLEMQLQKLQENSPLY